VRILKTVVASIKNKESTRVLVLETTVPQGNEPSWSKWLDLHMMVITGGKERTAEQFSKLFAASGLKLLRVIPTDSTICIVEAMAQ